MDTDDTWDDDPWGASLDEAAPARKVDVRRAAVFEQADTLIEGAVWRDPERVEDWASELPPGEPVVVYCVHGHEVGRRAAERLRAAGVDARFLRGGIEAWKAAGRPLQSK